MESVASLAALQFQPGAASPPSRPHPNIHLQFLPVCPKTPSAEASVSAGRSAAGISSKASVDLASLRPTDCWHVSDSSRAAVANTAPEMVTACEKTKLSKKGSSSGTGKVFSSTARRIANLPRKTRKDEDTCAVREFSRLRRSTVEIILAVMLPFASIHNRHAPRMHFPNAR